LSEDKNIKIARLISLEKKTREAKSKDELNFIVVNETREIIDYTTSFLLLKSATDKFHINAISDIASIDRTAPLVTFVESIINHKTKKDLKEIESIDLEQFSKKIKKQKPKNIPQYLLCIPIFSPQRGLQGYLLLARNKNFNDNENELVQHLSRTYGHAYNTFLANFSIKNFLNKNFTGKKRWIAISVFILIFLFPVRMTSTAPVEVVAKNPFLITSPFDGVVKKIIANNNDQTKPGDLLVLLEDIDLSNEFNLAKQSLQVAEKELLRTRQSSFTDNEQKSRLAELVAQVDLKRVELKSAERKLKNSKIYSEKKGVVIVDRKSDWQGKPVAVGEKILTIADPNNIEFLIWLPVKDSIVINQDANTNIFLDINPMSSYKGNIIRSTYEPELSPEEVLSYKLISSFKGNRDTPRIGLRGTAKVYGNRTILFYYLFRKPITFIRQLIGI